MNKYVIYTVITNGYDKLIEPEKVQSGIDYICFTDSTDLKSKTWEIRKIPEWIKNVPKNKRQRMLKVLPHVILPEYEMSLYIDGNVKIKGDAKKLFNVVSSHIISIPKHPARTCIYREGIAVMKIRKDIPENVMPQMERYLEEKFPTDYGLFETNIIFRKHNEPECKRLMDRWALEIMMGSHRDQLSLTYAMWATNTKVFALPKMTRNSDVFWTNMKHGDSGPANQKPNAIAKKVENELVKPKQNVQKKPVQKTPKKPKSPSKPNVKVNKIVQLKKAQSKNKPTNKKRGVRVSTLSLLS